MQKNANATHSRGSGSRRTKTAKARAKPEIVQDHAGSEDVADAEDVVVFTSYDGTIREVGDLPANLGRATALASEKSVSKVWGTPEEKDACRAMRKGI